MDERERELWADFQTNPNLENRDALFHEYAQWAAWVAGRKHAPSNIVMDADDCVATGAIGLIQCIGRFKPGDQGNFKGFAYRRVTGAVQDEYRKLDVLSVNDRKRGVPEPRLHSLDARCPRSGDLYHDITPSQARGPSDGLERRDLRRLLLRHSTLTEFKTISRVIWGGERLLDVARRYGLARTHLQSEQVLAAILAKLRLALADRHDELVLDNY